VSTSNENSRRKKSCRGETDVLLENTELIMSGCTTVRLTVQPSREKVLLYQNNNNNYLTDNEWDI